MTTTLSHNNPGTHLFSAQLALLALCRLQILSRLESPANLFSPAQLTSISNCVNKIAEKPSNFSHFPQQKHTLKYLAGTLGQNIFDPFLGVWNGLP